MSKKQSEIQLLTPLTMENIELIIVEKVVVRKCRCWNRVYEAGDPDCGRCFGTGIIKKRQTRLSRASLQPAGQLVDEGDPIAYACTFDELIIVNDIIVCRGIRYVVMEISAGYTTDDKEVRICGLNYERNYNHNQSDLERYK